MKSTTIRTVLSLLLMSPFYSQFAQTVTSLPNNGAFSPEIDDIESITEGIALYDQYCLLFANPKARNNSAGKHPDGKYEDRYESGQPLHEGNYEQGIVSSFENYYPNGQIERKIKCKNPGTGTIEAYYSNGNERFIRNYKNFKLLEDETYNNDGIVIIHQEFNKKDYTLLERATYFDNGNLKSKTEPKKESNSIYTYSSYTNEGTVLSQGDLKTNDETGELLKTGNWLQYNYGNKLETDVQYANGLIVEINKGEEIVINELKNDLCRALAEKFFPEEYQNNVSINIPENLALFDLNKNGEISVSELDDAINLFFDDITIEVTQIDDLVNFFFDQD